jgi:hypothetical protein
MLQQMTEVEMTFNKVEISVGLNEWKTSKITNSSLKIFI